MSGIPIVPRIHKTSTSSFPQFAFEWHEASQKVYLISLPGNFVDGVFIKGDNYSTIEAVCIAEHCEHHARFYGFVQTWLRGYKYGCSIQYQQFHSYNTPLEGDYNVR